MNRHFLFVQNAFISYMKKWRRRKSISIDYSVNPGIIVLINKMLLFYNSPLDQFIPLKLKNHLI